MKREEEKDRKEDYDYNPYPVQTGHVHHLNGMKEMEREEEN